MKKVNFFHTSPNIFMKLNLIVSDTPQSYMHFHKEDENR